MGTLNQVQQLIVEKVLSIAPACRITSTYRPNAGFHTEGIAVDFTSDRLHDLKTVFTTLTAEKWPGGISLGVPPAQIHLHVDARHLSAGKYWRCHFIETQPWNPATKSCGEVFSPSSHALSTPQLKAWREAWKLVCTTYK